MVKKFATLPSNIPDFIDKRVLFTRSREGVQIPCQGPQQGWEAHGLRTGPVLIKPVDPFEMAARLAALLDEA